MKRINLNGNWRLYYFPQGKCSISYPDQLDNEGITAIEASVPGNVELDLINAGVLPEDIFFADNILKLKQYEVYEWWYRCEFTSPGGIKGKKIELCFNGVDCLATYWLNGEELGSSGNMFIEHRFRVDDLLKNDDKNILTVRLKSPLLEASLKEYTPYFGLTWAKTNIEHVWIRKAAHSYGWDIMPRALSAGLWRPVELLVYGANEITDLYFFTFSLKGNRATLGVYYCLNTSLISRLPDFQIKISGRCCEHTFDITEYVANMAGVIWLDVENPRLWWPAGYGNPDLYEVTLQLVDNGEILAERIETIGIRTVELVHSDLTSPENPGQFLFKVNDTPIFCKGSNWVPADAFHSRDGKRYEKILQLFCDSGCNIVRCWGGNVYEDHGFFDFCDRNGLMVWQDFAMACAMYPQSSDFKEEMRKEAVSIVSKLRNHPSLILWCGDNECDITIISRGLNPNNNKITREILPEVIFQYDPYRPYLPSSPYYSPAAAVKKEFKLLPEVHLWGPRDYYKSKFYMDNNSHFISEIGYHGCPNLSAIKKFVDEEHLWPWQDNAQWITHATSIAGESGKHLRYAQRIKLMADQVKELFGTCPDNLADFITASQISQGEAKKTFIETARIRKWNRTGIIWWNMMDGWPQFSDAVVDYYFGRKLAYYYIRRVQKPICIMIDEPEGWYVRAVAGNDTREDKGGSCRIWDADTGETLLSGEFYAKANENTELGRIRVSHADKRLFLIQWTVDGKTYGNHYLLGFPAFSLEAYKIWLKKIAALQDDFCAEDIGG